MPANRTPSRDSQRIAKLLARAGVASRREVERMIAERRVAVNGTVIDTPATLLASLHGVTVDGQPVAQPAPARLFLYHKPTGLLVTERDPAGRPTIYDRLPRDLPRVVPVGRLDLNTEGLLLLTTDGELKRQLELPSSGVERTYRARAYGEVSQAQLESLIEGIEIDGIRYGAIDANLERRTGANVWIELTLTEGKNREVRRVLEHLGLKVSRLIRLRYGPFVLADLPPGEVGGVRQHDLVTFRKALGLPPAQRQFEAVAPAPRTKPEVKKEAEAPARPGRKPRPASAAAPTRKPHPRPEGEPRTGREPRAASAAAPARKPRPRPESEAGKTPQRTPGKLTPRKPKEGAAPIAKPTRAARARRFREAGSDTPATPRPRRPGKPRS